MAFRNSFPSFRWYFVFILYVMKKSLKTRGCSVVWLLLPFSISKRGKFQPAFFHGFQTISIPLLAARAESNRALGPNPFCFSNHRLQSHYGPGDSFLNCCFSFQAGMCFRHEFKL
jgi:hypothetical protein